MFSGAPYQLLKNSIDVSKYKFDSRRRSAIRNELKIPENTFVIGHVGGFREVKNHAFLLDIFAELQKRRNEAKLLLVGDGPLRSEAEQKVKSLGLENNVIFTGVRSDVNELMQAMDVFVFPSLYEGLPLTLVEAQAAGLPCCVSNTVSAEAAVTGNIHFLSLQAEPGSWAEEILLNAENFERCDTTSEIVRAGYDISACAVALEKFYLERSEQAK